MKKLTLYVNGVTPRAYTAMRNLEAACEHHLPGGYEIEVVDVWPNLT